MKPMNWDVLVVGAGPAGSSAARASALQGATTLLVDRRPQVGLPVRCAEYIPAQLLGQLDLGREFVAQSVQGLKTFLPDGSHTLTPAKGFMIHRDLFDQCLVRAAVAQGAELQLGTRVLYQAGMGPVIASDALHKGSYYQVQAKTIIGADGPHSVIGRGVGARNTNMLAGMQLTLPLKQQEKYTEIFFDQKIFGGYAWFFPKKDLVNIGLGMRPVKGYKKILRHTLGRLVQNFAQKMRIQQTPVNQTCGWIPAETVRKAVYHNILLTGDAAGQTHPITGAGISSAVCCGEMAGRWAARAAQANDPQLLQEYDQEWQDLFGDSLQRGFERRKLLESKWNNLEGIIKRTWVAFKEYYA